MFHLLVVKHTLAAYRRQTSFWCGVVAGLYQSLTEAPQSLSKDEELLLRDLDQDWALFILLRN